MTEDDSSHKVLKIAFPFALLPLRGRRKLIGQDQQAGRKLAFLAFASIGLIYSDT